MRPLSYPPPGHRRAATARVRPLGSALLLLAVAVLVAAGCGDDSDSAAQPTAGATASTPATTPSDPTSIEAHVITDSLAGLGAVGPPKTASTPEDFVKISGDPRPDSPDVLSKAGFVAGAVTEFGDGAYSSRSGLSSAVQLGSPAQARTVADQAATYLDGFQSDDAVRAGLPGVPGARTTSDHGTSEGPDGTYATVVFTDGPFLYVVWGGDAKGTVDPQDVLDDASALYTRVHAAAD